MIFVGGYSKPGYMHTNQVLFMILRTENGRADYRSHCFILQVVVDGISGTPATCTDSITGYVVMESETIELVIMEGGCRLWNETFKCSTFATDSEVNQNFKRN